MNREFVVCRSCGKITAKGAENFCMLCLRKDTQIPIDRINELTNHPHIVEENMGEQFGKISEDIIRKLIKLGSSAQCQLQK